MRISTKGFPEAVARLKQLAIAMESQKFQSVLVSALEPMAQQAKSNVHSVSGRTAQAIVVAAGKNLQYPSAYFKVDKKIASTPWRGKPFPYPYRVNILSGFFTNAVLGGRPGARRIVRDGIEDILRPYTTTLSIGGEFS